MGVDSPVDFLGVSAVTVPELTRWGQDVQEGIIAPTLIPGSSVPKATTVRQVKEIADIL